MELGWGLTPTGRSYFSGVIFQADSEDEIRYSDSDSSNVNAPKIRRKGVQIQARQAITKQIATYAALTVQSAEYEAGSNSGKDVPLVPRTLANIGGVYKLTSALSYHANLNYVSDQRYMDDDNNTKNRMPAYTLLDMGLRHSEKNWEVEFTVKNITDEKYATYGGYGFITKQPSSGYSYYYYPGDPRTFWLSARYRFN